MSWQERIQIVEGDLTQMDVDAIVNAANTSLLGGGGVDGAIHRAAGPELLAACHPLNGCETGEAKITAGFKLKARHVIHTPGPIWQGGNSNEPQLLANSYRNSLLLAVENHCKTVAFPAISMGVYGYPYDQASAIAVGEVKRFLEEGQPVDMVYHVCFGKEVLAAYQHALSQL